MNKRRKWHDSDIGIRILWKVPQNENQRVLERDRDYFGGNEKERCRNIVVCGPRQSLMEREDLFSKDTEICQIIIQ